MPRLFFNLIFLWMTLIFVHPSAAQSPTPEKKSAEKTSPEAEALQTAHVHLQKGRIEEAIETYTKLQMAGKIPTEVAIGLSRCYRETGDWKSALEVLSKALKAAPRTASLHAKVSELEFIKGQYQQAEKSARQAIKLDGSQPLARLMLAEIFTETGQIKKATEAYRLFIGFYNRKQPTDAETLLIVARGTLQYARWKRNSSISPFVLNTLCPDALKDDKHSWQTAKISGDLLLEKYNRRQALPEYDSALAINPRAAGVLVSLGHAAFMRYDLDKADEFADKALKVNEKFTAAIQLKTDTAITRGKLPLAETLIQKALAVNPNDQRSLARLAACYILEDGPPPQAELQDLLTNIDAIKQFSTKKPSRFSKLVAALAKRNPKPGYFLAVLGKRLEGRRKYGIAERFYKTAIRIMPELAEPQTSLGLLFMRTGKTKEAKKLLDSAFKADPYHVRVSNMRKVLKLLDGYESISTPHFVICVDSQADKILGKYMAEYLEEIYPTLVKQFGFEPPARTHFEIYHNGKGLKAHQWFSTRMIGLPWIQTVGASTGVMVALASPTAADSPFNWARVLKHEFVHIITLQQTKFNIPHWFTEALAVTAEGYPRSKTWDRLLLQRVPKGKLRTLKNLNEGFIRPRDSLDWQFAYCQSRLYAQYMVEKYGKESIPKLLEAYRKNLPTDRAIPAACGVELAVFEKGYLDFLNKLVAGLKGDLNQSTKSLADLEKVYTVDPTNSKAAAEYADALFTDNQRTKAREIAEKILAKNPKEPLAAIVMARIAILADKYDEALKILELAFDKKSPHQRVLILLAQLKIKDEKYGDAAGILELGHKTFPLNESVKRGLIVVYVRLDENEKLIPLLADLARYHFDDAAIRRKLAQLAMKTKNYPAAIKYGREVLHIDVLDVGIHRLLGKAYRELKKHVKSVEEFKVALELEPKNVATQLDLAKTHLAAGDKKNAKKLIEAVLKIDPENAEAKMLVESLE